MSSLLERMMKTGSIKSSSVLSKSAFFNAKESIPTELPILNIAFSGSIDGGLVPGLTVMAGESKTFKTMLSLYCMKAYLDKHTDGIALLYDSEFGITPEYIASFDIDTDRVLHIPIKDVEELKFDIVKKLQDIGDKEKVFIMIDSVGNLASKKEVEDAENEKSVADMSRAKSLKSLFRIITPYLTTKNIPCVAINHVYKEIGAMYAKTIVGGGCVVAGTEIQTPDGLKRVEDFTVGDRVNTLSGPLEVTHVWDPETLEDGNPECYEITFEDGHIVTVSDKHMFLIDGNWVQAKDLAEGLVCTILNP
jgi:RecA/RadA recombinase